MPIEAAIDTSVLQKANAPITVTPGGRSKFRKRLHLLSKIRDGDIVVLISDRLQAEYSRQIPAPRNDYVKAFFEMLVDPNRRVTNWQKRWSSGMRDRARRCRYPHEDDHVLRTALRPTPSFILTEERRMLLADACIYHEFDVHIDDPTR